MHSRSPPCVTTEVLYQDWVKFIRTSGLPTIRKQKQISYWPIRNGWRMAWSSNHLHGWWGTKITIKHRSILLQGIKCQNGSCSLNNIWDGTCMANKLPKPGLSCWEIVCFHWRGKSCDKATSNDKAPIQLRHDRTVHQGKMWVWHQWYGDHKLAGDERYDRKITWPKHFSTSNTRMMPQHAQSVMALTCSRHEQLLTCPDPTAMAYQETIWKQCLKVLWSNRTSSQIICC